MNDVERKLLRTVCQAVLRMQFLGAESRSHLADAVEEFDAMLRERGTAVGDNCVTRNQREMECQPPTLTDEERDAIRTAEGGYFAWRDDNGDGHSPERIAVSDTLRKLLERLA